MQSVAMMARPSFSWKKGLLHSVVVIAVFMLLGMIFAGFGAFGNQSDKIGEAAGEQLLLAFALAFAASYGFQTEKKVLGGLMLVLVTLLLAFQAHLFYRAYRVARNIADSGPMTSSEKEYPAREATRPRICQSSLGFSFPDPGDLSDPASAEDPARKSKPPANISRWMWMSGGGRIIVQAIKGMGRTEGDFRTFTTGLKEGFEESGGATTADENLVWTDGRGDFTISANFLNGTHLHMRCLSRGPDGDRSPLTVCLQTFTGAEDGLRKVEAGLEVAPCRIT